MLTSQVQKEKRDDLMAELEVLKQQHAAAVAECASTSGGSRSGMPVAMHAAAVIAHPPGKLHSPSSRSTSSKAGSIGLQVGSLPHRR